MNSRLSSHYRSTVVKAPKSSHITPILRSLHWLKINERIEYKLLSLTYKVHKLANLTTYTISYDTIRYDTIVELTWTRKLSIQLYLAHVARKKKLKQTTPVPL